MNEIGKDRMHKRTFEKTFIALLAFLLIWILACGCTQKIKIKTYPAVPTEYAYTVDDSIPRANLVTAATKNQSRGFRGETYITLGRTEAYPDSGEPYVEKLESELRRLALDGIQVMQVYVYLIEYYNTSLPKSALVQLREYLKLIQTKGIKILLRFAYETTEGQKNGPRTKDIQNHCAQLKSFFRDNEELFCRTVYAVQLGMIGLWGEGHGSVHRHDVTKVIEAVADMVPEPTPIMVRTPEMLSAVPERLEHRFGMHEDYVVGYNDPWVAISTDHPSYSAVTTKCKYAVTDGEMPWGRANVPIEMIEALKTCVDFGMTTFSLAHNYTEEGEHNLKQWQSVPLEESDLKANGLPYNPALLTNGKITAFNYLKYHLGYQLVASNITFENGTARFLLSNYGFACPYGYTLEIYVNGEPVTLQETHTLQTLTQFSQQYYTFPYVDGEIAVRIVSTRDPSDAIRLLNNIPYRDDAQTNLIYLGHYV